MSLVVLKLGGSLLSCRDIADRLRQFFAGLKSARVLIVVGGGGSADVVREWSQRFDLTEEAGHWIALRSLSVTRALVKTLIPGLGEVTSRDEALRFWKDQQSPLLLDIESSLSQSESQGAITLPHTWDTTSDSIAAWVAQEWDASELILLKSVDLPEVATLDVACAAELVDANFPQVAKQIPHVRWCNLTAKTPQIVRWLRHGVPDEFE